MSATVRINPQTHDKLRQISEVANETMTVMLDKAIDAYHRQLFLKQANESFARLRKNPKAWKQEMAERKAWDATLADGLEDD